MIANPKPTFRIDKNVLIENYDYAVNLMKDTHIQVEVTEKLFYEKILDAAFFNDKIFWTNSLKRQNKNTLFLNRYDSNAGGGIWNDYEAICEKIALESNSDYRLWIPVDIMEKREGISIKEALMLIKKLKDLGYRIEGLLVNGFCSENAHFDWKESLSEIDAIANQQNLKISIGGSAFLLQADFLKSLKSICSLRTGEFIITGRIADHHDELYRGKNPFEIEAPVLWASKSDHRFIIPMGSGMIHSDCMFEQSDIQIKSISTDYTVLQASEPYKHKTLTIKPDYYTLGKLLGPWGEYLEEQ